MGGAGRPGGLNEDCISLTSFKEVSWSFSGVCLSTLMMKNGCSVINQEETVLGFLEITAFILIGIQLQRN